MRSLVVFCLVASGMAQMILTSPEFDGNVAIPAQYGCDTTFRDDYRPSPPLTWFRAPAKTQSFVLLVDDMDNNGFVQWFVKDIPRNVSSLPADASEVNMPKGAIELSNSRGFDSFSGPCPDFEQSHNYRFRLFAMPTAYTPIQRINPITLTADQVLSQIQDNALYVAVLVTSFRLGKFVPLNTTAPSPTRITTTRIVNGTVLVNGTRVHRNITITNTTYVPVPSPAPSKQRMRPVLPDQLIPATRFVKPSEAIKPKRQHFETLVDPACADPTAAVTAECIIQKARLAVYGNNTANQTLTLSRRRQVSMQSLVDEGVQSFKRELDLWDCEEEFRRNAGVRLVGNETQSCSLHMKVTDARCIDPLYPRQFVCSKQPDENFGLSPSLMWRDAPAETQSFVVIVEESSDLQFARDYGKVYWLVTNIPSANTRIEAGASGHDKEMPPLSVEHRNSFNTLGYTAPCPEEHDQRIYRLRVFAMPHTLTRMPFTSQPVASQIVQQLQKQALCMSTVELPFSFSRSHVTETHHLQQKQIVEAEVVAGEGTAESAESDSAAAAVAE